MVERVIYKVMIKLSGANFIKRVVFAHQVSQLFLDIIDNIGKWIKLLYPTQLPKNAIDDYLKIADNGRSGILLFLPNSFAVLNFVFGDL